MADSSSHSEGAAGSQTRGVATARAQVEAARLRQQALMAAGRLTQLTGGDTPLPSREFPGYLLLNEIHRGGQGVVYQALQKSTNRKVAIKVLLEGLHASKSARQRFDREIELVAGLRHPNVISVFHSDQTPDGLRYCVMDYVRGLPLNKYVHDNRLTLHETLKLFTQICDAVNHAHQKGVIHRDLKPSNILVEVDGIPRVLDFGLAKLVGAAEQSLVSMTGQVVGTLPYMSPEQTRGNPDEIDTRTDVYSLGVLLYEILTGHYPYPVVGPIADVLKNIAEAEPTPPSHYGWQGLSQGSSRGSFIHPAAGIDDELQTIVLKALAKDRDRRYQSAGELARDIEHYLANEPIEAKRDSALYVLGKQLSRHRAAVAVALCFALLLAGGLATSMALWLRAEKALVEKETQRKLAEQRQRETEEVARFHSTMFERIDPQAMGRSLKDQLREQVAASLNRQYVGNGPDRRKVNPDEIAARLQAFDTAAGPVQAADVARGILVKFVLSTAAEAANTKFAEQPRVRAQLLHTLGSMYLTLGIFDQAETLLRQALETREGVEDEDLVSTLSQLGGLFSQTGRAADAEKMHRRALEVARSTLGDANELTVSCIHNVAATLVAQGNLDAAEELMREALALARTLPPPNARMLPTALTALGALLIRKSDYASAEPLIREAVEIRRTSPDALPQDVASGLNSLSRVLYYRGDVAGAERLQAEALKRWRESAGDDDAEVARMMRMLASLRDELSDRASAEELGIESLAIQRRLLGNDHPEVADGLNSLAVQYQQHGDYAKAEPLLREAIEIRRSALGTAHPDYAASITNLAANFRRRGAPAEAEPLYREALLIYEKRLPPKHPLYFIARVGLGRSLTAMNRLDEAEAMLTAANEAAGDSPLPARMRQNMVEGFIDLWEARNRATPGQGYDQKAADWRKKLAPPR